MKRRLMVLLGLVVLLASFVGPAVAGGVPPRVIGDDVADTPIEVHDQHDEQHGGVGGHLPASSRNVELVGRITVSGAEPGHIADVAAFGNYAYLTARDTAGGATVCTNAGVYVIDISDPANPREVGFIPATEGSQPGEGAQILDLKTASFRGQILVFNNELCASGGEGGVSLWDVSNPLRPVVLTAHAGDTTPSASSLYNQIHSAFAWQDVATKRAFVVLVDNEEAKDVDILEITDPRNPVLIAELNLNDFGVLQENAPNGQAAFLHDMIVKRIGNDYIMLLSYWDGGFVLLNVNDPANPTFLGDTDYPATDPLTGITPPEGNAHQAEFSHNNKYIIGTDEDFSPYRLTVGLSSGPFAGQQFTAAQASAARPIAPGTALAGSTTFVGQACAALPPASGPTAIAVVERGGCTFQVKLNNIKAAGYAAGIVFNNTTGCEALVRMAATGDIPFLFVSRSTGYKLLGIAGYNPANCATGPNPPLPAVGTPGANVSVSQVFDGWGYVQLYDARTLAYLGSYAIPEALDPRYASGFGDLSVHEVATDPNQDLAYLSYYAGGLRVIRFGREGIEEAGHYIAEGGNNFWGVEVHKLPQGTPGRGKETLILASDRDSGLWIFRYTGKP